MCHRSCDLYSRQIEAKEVNQYGTEPLNEDTDGDTITDGDEILLGLNPLLADSDGDGIADNEEKIEQAFGAAIEDEEKPEVTNVEVAFAGTGNFIHSQPREH